MSINTGADQPENQAECDKLSDKNKRELVDRFFLNNTIHGRSNPLESLTPNAKKELQNWVKTYVRYETSYYVLEEIAIKPEYAEMLDTMLSACADRYDLLRQIIVKILDQGQITLDTIRSKVLNKCQTINKYSKENINHFQDTLAKVAHSINLLADTKSTINTIIKALRALRRQDNNDDCIAATGLFLGLLEKLKVNFNGLTLKKHKDIVKGLNEIPLAQSKSIILEVLSKKGFDKDKFNLFDQFPMAESLLFEPGMSTYRFNTAAYLMQQYCNSKKDTIVHWLVRASFESDKIDSRMVEIKSKIAGARQANLVPQNFNQRNSKGETPLQIFGRQVFEIIKSNSFSKDSASICKVLSEKLTAAFTWEENNEPANKVDNPDPEYAIRLFIAAAADNNESNTKIRQILCNHAVNPNQIAVALMLTYEQLQPVLKKIMASIFEIATSDNREEKQALLSNAHIRFFLYRNKDLLKMIFDEKYETLKKKKLKQLSSIQTKLIQSQGVSQFADYLTDKEHFFKRQFASFFYKSFLQGKWLTDAKSSVGNSKKFKY